MKQRRRVLMVECMQEICSFNPLPSTYENFHIERDSGMLAQRGLNTSLGGALTAFGETGVEPVLAISARAGSGGQLSAAAWNRLASEVLEAIATLAATGVDGVYFSLHGAMGSDGEPDPEGYLLSHTRAIVGKHIPIVISLDLHGIMTDRMLRQINGVAIYHTYPHVDFATTGQRAAHILYRLMTEELHPVIARVVIPALVRGDELLTKSGCYGELIRDARCLEREGGVMSAGILIGNPFTDVPELCSQVIVGTSGDGAVASSQALRLAREFWPLRHRMQGKLVSLERSIQLAASIIGPVVFTDAADATSSGATGDSNLILKGLREAGYARSVLAQIVDPDAAALAHKAGVGAMITVGLGGALDPGRYSPLVVKARVRLLSDGKARLETMKTGLNAGPTAVLEFDNFSVLVMSRSVSLFDRAMYYANGLNPQDFSLTVVKSPHTEHHMYDAWVDSNFNIDVAGATSANLKSLGHVVCARPIFPLDDAVVFEPVVTLYGNQSPFVPDKI